MKVPKDESTAVAQKIVHKDFAKRMIQACDGNRDIPDKNKGRLVWLVEQLDGKGIYSTKETVRKWFTGENYPRQSTVTALAEILKVDEAWLAVGRAAELDVKQAKLRSAEVDGIVNVVAGLIQIHGGNPAFPQPNDERAKEQHIDIYTIIRGAQYSMHVTLGQMVGDEWRFAVPVGAENTFILGAVLVGDTAIEMIEIDLEGLVEHSSKRSGMFELKVNKHYEANGHAFKRILHFRERL